MNDRATATAVSLFPCFLASVLFFAAPNALIAQPSVPPGDSAARPQPTINDPMARIRERPATPQSTPQANNEGEGGARAARQAAPANRDPMRFQAAPPVQPPPTAQAQTPAEQTPSREVAAPPRKAAADPMRFQPAPVAETPAPAAAPAERSVAAVPKEKAAPAPIRTQPAPRFEVRGPETVAEEVFPGPDDQITLDELPQFDASELGRNVRTQKSSVPEGMQGRVLVRVLVNRSGGVLKRIVEYSSNQELNSAAVEAVAATRFKPAVLKGVAVAAWITVPVNFASDSDRSEPGR